MKRLVTLAIMAAFILGTAGLAKANVEFNIIGGEFRTHVDAVKNPTFDSDDNVDTFNAYQRFRTNFEVVANENLRAFMQIQYGPTGAGENRWGDDPGQGGISEVGFRQAYLDFMIPNTEAQVKAGWQHFALPSTVGSHIFDGRAPGLTMHTPISPEVGITAGWLRADDNEQGPVATSGDRRDDRDHFFAVVPVTLDGVEVNPFVWHTEEGRGFSYDDDETNNQTRGITYGGINATVDMFDPIVVHADFNYGSAGTRNDADPDANRLGQTRGWMAALAVDYHMDFMTPRAYFLYESGESSSSLDADNRGKRMPVVAPDLNNLTSFGFNSGEFGDVGFGQNRIAQFFPTHNGGDTTIGAWSLGVQLMDISFMDNLTHELQLAYYQGTNNKDLRDEDQFTTRDSAWEVNFNTKYDVYENLAAIVELGYLGLSLSEDTPGARMEDDDAWKASTGLKFSF